MSTISRRRVLQAATGAVAVGLAATLTGCVGGAAQPRRMRPGPPRCTWSASPCRRRRTTRSRRSSPRPPDGKGVVWEESYGASGDQSRAVVNGLKADYVNFSLEGDVTRLVKAGLVDRGLEVRADQGHRLGLGRRHRGAEGQPAGHQGLGRT